MRIITVLLTGFVLLAVTGCGSSTPEVSEQFDYEGELKGNLAHGLGAIYEDGMLVYEGTFEDGIISGRGSYYENGVLRYEGEIRQAVPLGEGTIYRQGMRLFSGEILKNEGDTMTLRGIVYNSDEEPFYSGDLEIQGDAILLPASGTLLYPSGAVYYIGDLDDGLPVRVGTYYAEDGSVLFDRR